MKSAWENTINKHAQISPTEFQELVATRLGSHKVIRQEHSTQLSYVNLENFENVARKAIEDGVQHGQSLLENALREKSGQYTHHLVQTFHSEEHARNFIALGQKAMPELKEAMPSLSYRPMDSSDSTEFQIPFDAHSPEDGNIHMKYALSPNHDGTCKVVGEATYTINAREPFEKALESMQDEKIKNDVYSELSDQVMEKIQSFSHDHDNEIPLTQASHKKPITSDVSTPSESLLQDWKKLHEQPEFATRTSDAKDVKLQAAWDRAQSLNIAWNKATQSVNTEVGTHTPTEKTSNSTAEQNRPASDYHNHMLTDEAYAKDLEKGDLLPESKLYLRMHNLENHERYGVRKFLENVMPELEQLSKENQEYALKRFFEHCASDQYLNKNWESSRKDLRKTFIDLAKPSSLSMLVKNIRGLRVDNLPQGIETSDLPQFFISLHQYIQALQPIKAKL